MKLKGLTLAASLAFISTVTSAVSAVVTYDYVGSPLDTLSVYKPSGIEVTQVENPFRFEATLTIDEEAAGLSHINLDLEGISYGEPESYLSQNVDGITLTASAIYLSGTGGPLNALPSIPETFLQTLIVIQTDENGEITNGRVEWLSGPPDGSFSQVRSTFDYYGTYYEQLSGGPGVWSLTSVVGDPFPPTTPIPLPASGLFLFAGIVALMRFRPRL